jgi:hypothetical protein
MSTQMKPEDIADIVRNIIGVGPIAQGDEGHPNGNSAPWVLTFGGFTAPGDEPCYRAFSVVPLKGAFDLASTNRPCLATYGATFGIPNGWAVVMIPVHGLDEDPAILAAREWASTCAGAS